MRMRMRMRIQKLLGKLKPNTTQATKGKERQFSLWWRVKMRQLFSERHEDNHLYPLWPVASGSREQTCSWPRRRQPTWRPVSTWVTDGVAAPFRCFRQRLAVGWPLRLPPSVSATTLTPATRRQPSPPTLSSRPVISRVNRCEVMAAHQSSSMAVLIVHHKWMYLTRTMWSLPVENITPHGALRGPPEDCACAINLLCGCYLIVLWC